MDAAGEELVAALDAVTRGAWDEAAKRAEQARSLAPDRLLPGALGEHLARGRDDVYSEPEAFERFIDGGGNVGLYEHAGRALAAVHAEHRPERVLDIGCGEGRLTAASLRDGLRHLDLVEPSAELMDRACRRLEGHGAEVACHAMGAEEVATTLAGERWGLAQSTFALHAVAPGARAAVLADLVGRVDALLLVEFDVPAFTDRSEDHLRYLVERYEVGLAEYAGDTVVAQGFLLPVLVAQIAPDKARHTWEQPVAAWGDELRAAGFASVRHRKVSDYWWAPAHLVEASP
ncbi:class I SAM-dependent methyltransferase [Iamia sp. SCSIO 61187]|uniref:class I SAM-dependent methyltransferase n=1 Tax=Iamia sp. SCSIO 61187 TaxID=2722752 RepID=UPI001C62A0C3|nr:class I SAM-dependent methyltransferase [Iamia sp. SCSIO 61187]QYG95111.1 class I SAM-dependent methyltransferase [Iamia sp. SCSIO 61187]